MGITDFLRKIGLLRTEAQSWQGDASQRPLEEPFLGTSAEKNSKENKETETAKEENQQQKKPISEDETEKTPEKKLEEN